MPSSPTAGTGQYSRPPHEIALSRAIQCWTMANLRVIALASPSSSASAMTVALLRAPFGLPFGLPLLPRAKGRPRCIAAVFSALSKVSMDADHRSVTEDKPIALPLLFFKLADSTDFARKTLLQNRFIYNHLTRFVDGHEIALRLPNRISSSMLAYVSPLIRRQSAIEPAGTLSSARTRLPLCLHAMPRYLYAKNCWGSKKVA